MKSFNGLVLVDKPEGLTSHDVVNRLRRLFSTRTVGHAGTLDPLATGLLVLMVGEATKLSDYILAGKKTYLAEITLGIETDTQDITGEVVAEQKVDVTGQQLAATIADLKGMLDLPVPRYSAVKVKGQKLYVKARSRAEMPEVIRTMHFFQADLIEHQGSKVWVRLGCDKGGYVRSWASELGRRLLCGATISGLRREISEPYLLDHAVTLPVLESAIADMEERNEGLEVFLPNSCISLAQALPNLPHLPVGHRDEKLMRNGAISDALRVQLRVSPRFKGSKLVKVISQDSHQLVSLLEAREPAGYTIRRVFRAHS